MIKNLSLKTISLAKKFCLIVNILREKEIISFKISFLNSFVYISSGQTDP